MRMGKYIYIANYVIVATDIASYYYCYQYFTFNITVMQFSYIDCFLRLKYLLCNSEAKTNKYGLIFGGQMNKQVTLCTFNLASGKCKGSNNECISNSEVFPTSFNMPSSIISSSIKMLTVTTLFVSATKVPGLLMNIVTSNNVTIIPNSTTSTITAMSNSAPAPIIITTSGFTSFSKLTLQSSSKLVTTSMQSLNITKRSSAVSPSNTVASISPVPTSTTLSTSFSVQSSVVLSISLTSIPFNSDIVLSSGITQIYNTPTPTNSPLSSVTSWSILQSFSKLTLSTGTSSLSSSYTLMNTLDELSVSVHSTELPSTSASILAPTSAFMTGDNVLPSNTI